MRHLLTVGWLSHFNTDLVDALLSEGRFFKAEKGETLYDIGQQQVCLYCMVSGSARFEISMNEQPTRLGHLIGPGFWFGENELALGKSAILEVTCTSKAVIFYVTDRQFAAIAARHTHAWKAIAALSSMNVGLAIGAADDLMLRTSRQRLCAVILRLAARRNAFQGQPPLDTLFLTQTDLSTAANLSRSKTAEITGSLADAGAIQTIYGGLKILRPEILEKELVVGI